jgi:DNA mismatch endonuclease, patch repair protein
MADIYTREKRSEIMSKVVSRDTKPEMLVRSYLFRNGFRFRKNVSKLAGKPDIVLSKLRTVIFVNGCFWHSHNCKAGRLPKTNTAFWAAKILSNSQRDKRNQKSLRAEGWKVLVIWQCKLKSTLSVLRTMKSLLKSLNRNVHY